MAEKKPRFVMEKCLFCCIPLRTGCLILAYLVLICSIVNIYFAAVTFYHTFMMMDIVPEMYKQLILTFSIIGFIDLVLSTCVVPFNIVLPIGLHKEKPHFVKIFLIFMVVITALTVLKRIVTLFLSTAGHLLGIAVTLLYLMFNVYYILVLRSHYLKMMESIQNLPKNEGQQP